MVFFTVFWICLILPAWGQTFINPSRQCSFHDGKCAYYVSLSHKGQCNANNQGSLNSKQLEDVFKGVSEVFTKSIAELAKNLSVGGSFDDEKLKQEIQKLSANFQNQVANVTMALGDLERKVTTSIQDTDLKLTRLQNEVQMLKIENADLKNMTELLQKNKGLTMPKDCTQVPPSGTTYSGVTTILPTGFTQPIRVYCDKGWIAIAHKSGYKTGPVNFNKTWTEYKNGFGDLSSSDFYLGNHFIHLLTKNRDYKLRVEITDEKDDKKYYADYWDFKIDGESDKYRLTASNYTGTAGDGFNHGDFQFKQNGRYFSTPDQDNDPEPKLHCAKKYGAGFWYAGCYSSDVFGDMQWYAKAFEVKEVVMKIIPK